LLPLLPLFQRKHHWIYAKARRSRLDVEAELSIC
jgi:hypothetical protein